MIRTIGKFKSTTCLLVATLVSYANSFDPDERDSVVPHPSLRCLTLNVSISVYKKLAIFWSFNNWQMRACACANFSGSQLQTANEICGGENGYNGWDKVSEVISLQLYREAWTKLYPDDCLNASTPSNPASHSGPSCLTLCHWFNQRCRVSV